MSTLQSMNTKQLKAKCKALKIQNYGSLTKDKLIEVITMKLSGADDKPSQNEDSNVPQVKTKDDSKKINLCDTCNLEFATCPSNNKVFGEVEYNDFNDNVIECDGHQPIPPKKEKEDTVDPTAMVKYEKLIKGAFGFSGNNYKGNFELSKKDSEHRKIKNAIESGIIRIKK